MNLYGLLENLDGDSSSGEQRIHSKSFSIHLSSAQELIQLDSGLVNKRAYIHTRTHEKIFAHAHNIFQNWIIAHVFLLCHTTHIAYVCSMCLKTPGPYQTKQMKIMFKARALSLSQ